MSPARVVAALLSAALATTTDIHAQNCSDAHYRWTVKTTLAQQGVAGTATTPAAMLTWTPLDLYRPGGHDCTARAGKELTVYAVTGWVRTWKVEKAPGDLDWHLELTENASSKRTKCIVVEIPDPQFGAIYQQARQDFLDLITHSTINAKKQVIPAVRIRVTGPAFFDAQHRGARGSGNPPSGHGHCNSSASALWEIHPVYAVSAP